jgi:hypothetical protein
MNGEVMNFLFAWGSDFLGLGLIFISLRAENGGYAGVENCFYMPNTSKSKWAQASGR